MEGSEGRPCRPSGRGARCLGARCLPIAIQSLTCARHFVLSYTPKLWIPNRFVSDEPSSHPLTFQPIGPFRPRHDGWTAEKQITFIEALAETTCVEEACRRVGMSPVGLCITAAPMRMAFRDAWDAALDYSLHQLEQAAIGRAIHGVPRPIFYKGEQVGESRSMMSGSPCSCSAIVHRSAIGAWIDSEPSPQHPENEVCLD